MSDAPVRANGSSPVMEDVLRRICGEYTEMPGLRLTLEQAQRLWGLDAALCQLILDALVESGFLRRTETGQYLRQSDGPATLLKLRTVKVNIEERLTGSSYRRPAASSR